MVIDPRAILRVVAKTKRVTPDVLAAFADVLGRWVKEHHGGNQTRAGKALGVTQSHVSAMLTGQRGPGLNTLILMRDQTGLSIDTMLGLVPPKQAQAQDLPEPSTVSRSDVLAILAAELEARGIRVPVRRGR